MMKKTPLIIIIVLLAIIAGSLIYLIIDGKKKENVEDAQIQLLRDKIQEDTTFLLALAQQYAKKIEFMEKRPATFIGFEIPDSYKFSLNAEYSVLDATDDFIEIEAFAGGMIGKNGITPIKFLGSIVNGEIKVKEIN